MFTRAFKGSEVEEALRFLLVPTERIDAIRETLQRLVTELHATGRSRSSRAHHDGPAARPAPPDVVVNRGDAHAGRGS
jgi:hypothetical protein